MGVENQAACSGVSLDWEQSYDDSVNLRFLQILLPPSDSLENLV